MEHFTADIGSRLKQAREQRGLTIRDIANTTKISTSALNAIERNEFARLPGGVYSRAYVRAFATEVGLDAGELTREYRARFEIEIAAEAVPQRKAHWLDHVRLFHRWPTVLVTVGFLVGISVTLKRAQIPHQSPDQQSTFTAGEADLLEDPLPTSERDATAEVAVAANTAVSVAGEQSLRLEIGVNGPCWVSAVADGQRVVYRLMQPGERTLVEARSLITLRVGDAGAVAYSINGMTGRPLGRNGQAVTVRITNDNLEGLAAEPASAIPAKGAATRIRSGPVGRGVEANGHRAVAASIIRPSDEFEGRGVGHLRPRPLPRPFPRSQL